MPQKSIHRWSISQKSHKKHKFLPWCPRLTLPGAIFIIRGLFFIRPFLLRNL